MKDYESTKYFKYKIKRNFGELEEIFQMSLTVNLFI